MKERLVEQHQHLLLETDSYVELNRKEKEKVAQVEAKVSFTQFTLITLRYCLIVFQSTTRVSRLHNTVVIAVWPTSIHLKWIKVNMWEPRYELDRWGIRQKHFFPVMQMKAMQSRIWEKKKQLGRLSSTHSKPLQRMKHIRFLEGRLSQVIQHTSACMHTY